MHAKDNLIRKNWQEQGGMCLVHHQEDG